MISAKMTAADAASFLGVSLQAVHKQLRTKQLPFEKSQNRVYFGHETSRGLFQIPFGPRTIAFQIVKGGTGKTSLAYSVARRAHLYGARVLCIDLDQQGNFTQALQVRAEEHPCMADILEGQLNFGESIVQVEDGLDVLPSRIENSVLDNILMLKRMPLDRVYADLFAPLRSKYDLILIDCPPALGSSVAAAALASDLILAPVTPEKFSLSGLKLTTTEIASLEKAYKRSIPVRIVLNKYDNRTALSHDVLTQLVKHHIFGEMLFKSYVRHSQEFPNATAKGESVFDVIRETSAKEDVDLLTVELLDIAKSKSRKDSISLGNIETAQAVAV